MTLTTTKGFFLNALVKIAEEKQGEKALETIKEKFGRVKFSGFRNYDDQTTNDLIALVAELVYGGNTPEAQVELGKQAFNAFTQSPIGKTVTKLYGGSALRLAKNTTSIADALGMTNVLPEKVTENEANFHYKNVAFTPHFYHGMIIDAAEKFNLILDGVKIEEKAPHEFTIKIN